MECCPDNCLDVFTKSFVISTRSLTVTKTAQEKTEAIMKIIENGLIQPYNRKKDFWLVDGKLVCTEAFKKLYGFTRHQVIKAKSLSKKGLHYPTHGNTGTIRHSIRYESCKTWLSKYFTAICDTFENTVKEVPIYVNKNLIYADMIDELKLNMRDFTPSQFYQLLIKDFQNIKFPKKTRLGRCDTCLELQSKINLTRKVDSNERIQFVEQRRAHTEMHKSERTLYMQRCEYSRLHPDEVIHLTIDEMTHFFLPFPRPAVKGWTGQKLLQVNLIGIENHTFESTDFYVAPNFWGKGAKITCSIIWKHLCDLSEKKPLPKKLWIQFDNCWRDNKNKYTMAFFGMLVAKGIFNEIELNCLPTGHTHVHIDQIFSNFSKLYWSKGLLSLYHFKDEFLNKAYHKHPPSLTWITEIYDWNAKFEHQTCKAKYLVEQRSFRIIMHENQPAFFWKEKMGDSNWSGAEGTNFPIKIFKFSVDCLDAQNTLHKFPAVFPIVAIDHEILVCLDNKLTRQQLSKETDHLEWLVNFIKNPTPSYFAPPWALSWDSFKVQSSVVTIQVPSQSEKTHHSIETIEDEQFSTPAQLVDNATIYAMDNQDIVAIKNSGSTYLLMTITNSQGPIWKGRQVHGQGKGKRCKISPITFDIHPDSIMVKNIQLGSNGNLLKRIETASNTALRNTTNKDNNALLALFHKDSSNYRLL